MSSSENSRANWRQLSLAVLAIGYLSAGCSDDDEPVYDNEAVAGRTGVAGGTAKTTGGASSATGGSTSMTGVAGATGGSASITGGASSTSGGATSAVAGTTSYTGGATGVTGGATSLSGGAPSATGGVGAISEGGTSTVTGQAGVAGWVTSTIPVASGIEVTASEGLQTSELGGQVTFSIVLKVLPSADVTIPLLSSDTSEGVVSPMSLTFTPSNWNAPQQITVTGVDDHVADGGVAYSIVTGPAQSADANYDTLNAADVSIVNVDNETPGVTVSAESNLATTEAGGQTTFTVSLNSQPAADVVIGLTSNDTSEGTVNPSSLTFTAENWNALQIVTVTGVDDPAMDGNISYLIQTSAAQSTDSGYNGLAVDDVTVENTDDETAGITVNKSDELATTEAGGQTSFTVVLNSAPTANVVLSVASSDATEGVVSVSSLTFTSDNWNAPQTITLTGQDDLVADGNQPYNVLLGPATSSDANYTGMAVPNVSVSNTDNDSAGITVTAAEDLTTTEVGDQASFTVVLNSQPTADVMLNVASSDTSEGNVSAASLTFTEANWNAPQTITLTGQDDLMADGKQPYHVLIGPAVSSDAEYNGKTVPHVGVSNTDNDSAGISVTAAENLSTTESGGQTSFTVVLNSQPTADVVLSVTSSDTTEGTVSAPSLTFTEANWNAPQTVTLTGQNDFVVDGNQPYSILIGAAVSEDSGYSGRTVPNVAVSNTDNDSAGITVTATANLSTTEAGGQTSFTVVLNSEPTADVVLGVMSSDTSEGDVSTAMLTFTAENWNAPQTVTLTGQDDFVMDGSQPYNVLLGPAASSDTNYSGMTVPNVAVSNTDNDSAGITVTAAANLTTTEAGGQTSFTVVLNSEPTANVVLNVASNDTTEGTVSAASLTFTAANWNAPQTVTITGQNDFVADGSQAYAILVGPAVSSDAGYSGRNVPNVAVSNTDNDSAGITVTAAANLTTTEAGGQTSFTVVLNSEPTANVVLSVASNDATEGTASAASLTFTAANWNAPQTVTITGQNDFVADGNQAYAILVGPAVSSDAGYSGRTVPNVAVSNTDNDSAGITVTAAANLTTTEAGAQTSFKVVLNSEPTANVVLSVASNDTTEGTVSAASLTFTAANWNAPQTVTITGQNDFVADGNQAYAILVGPAVSSDAGYSGRTVPNVAVSNTDNDSAGITVTAAANLTTTEAGAQTSFTVVLNSEPTANVVLSVASNDTTEGTVNAASLTFTAANWNAPQTVTITGQNDFVADGNQAYAILVGPAVSSDAGYSARTVPNVAVSNTDNDSAGITVTAAANLTTTEAGAQTSFKVVLNSEPTANVVLSVASNDTTEGTVSAASLTFTAANWNAPQTVTITGQNDFVVDGNQAYAILVGPAVSSDAGYSARTVPNVAVSNTDNDSAGITVAAAANLTTTEAGGQTSFTVVLNSEPTANVVLSVASNDTTEGTVNAPSLTFTAANWSAPQTVTITGQNDFVADGNQAYAILVGPAVSSDAGYSGRTVPNVAVSNTDNDSAGITVTAAANLTTTEAGGQASFKVVLNSEPTANVVLSVASGDTTEGTVSAASLTFTAANWSTAQTVTLTGQNDAVADGNQPYNVLLGPAVSTDAGYSGRTVPNVGLTNTDNDSAGITVTAAANLTTTEAGGQASFTVVLNSEPTANVALSVASSDTTEGTVGAASLTFTAANWNAPQTVTVTGQNDAVADGNQPYNVLLGPAVSTDASYSGRSVPNVALTNTDNDSAGITVSPTSISTGEWGLNGTFTVVLTSEPTANVTISVTSGDTTEGTVSPASLTFTASNWNTAQTVTVTAVNDSTFDGDQTYTVTLGAAVSADPKYSGKDPSDVSVKNLEAALSCKSLHADQPALASGIYRLDTDGTGANSPFDAYCDMETDGGGWTLLSWTADSGASPLGVPYPGLAACAALNCARGSGVPAVAINALLSNSNELGQGQSGSADTKTTFGVLGSYQYAAKYVYSSLSGLNTQYVSGNCDSAGFSKGVFRNIRNTTSDGAAVYLAQGFRLCGTFDFSSDSNSSIWSIGVTTNYCNCSGIKPISALGTWSPGQYGPEVMYQVGSYSVWVR